MLKLAFSKGSEGVQGSPYVKLGPNGYLIFSTVTMTKTGFKYLIFSNAALEEGDKSNQSNGSFITNMKCKGTDEEKSMGLSSEFKRTPHYPLAIVVRDLIAPYLNDKDEFPESAMGSFAEDIIKFNNNDPEILKRLKGVEKEKRTRKTKKIPIQKAKKEKKVKKVVKEKKVKAVKTKKVKKVKKTKATKKVKKVVKAKKVKKTTTKTPKKVKKVKVVKTKKVVKKPAKKVKKTSKTMRKAARGRKSTKKGKRK